MNFEYSRYNLKGKEKILERILEILPGFLSWFIILGMAILSFIRPILAAVIIIAFILYWVVRLIYMNIFLVLSYARLTIERNTDWMKHISAIDRLDKQPQEFCLAPGRKNIKDIISSVIHCRQLRRLKISGDLPPKSENLYHLVIIPVIKEGKEIVEPGLLGIKESKYPASRILVIIALEESAPSEIKEDVAELANKYKGGFLDLIVVKHPNNLPGEAAVKGANVTYAAKYAAEYFKQRNIAYDNVIVSCFDADTVARADYFSCLTYHFMAAANRTNASYQPIPVYHNNIWEVPSFARIIDIGTSFFQLIEATNPKKMVTFSSHSMSFKALVDMGYWPVDMISDDSAIFWKAFIHYRGRYEVVPIYTTVSMDIVTGKNLLQTVSNIYKQKRRWAWGVENLPIVLRAFLQLKEIPLFKKLTYGFKLFDAFISWATWSFLLGFVSWIPAFFARREFASTTVYYIAPRIRTSIFGLASLGIVICMIISLLLLPKAKKARNISKNILHAFEWFIIPVAVLVLSAIPALDAQTRLMFGRYLEFWVAEKYRKEDKDD